MNNTNRYPNELSFSRYFVKALKNDGHFVQRIESGLTGKGIPDIFAIVEGTPMWIELKRVKRKVAKSNAIPWRPGQRAWLRSVGVHMMAYTCVMFEDCIGVITHGMHPSRPLDYPKNKVPKDKMFICCSASAAADYMAFGMPPAKIMKE